MDERKPKRRAAAGAVAMFQTGNRKRHLRLFLPKYLAEEADRLMVDAAELERVGAILKNWAESARDGHLDKKETTLDGDFLQKIFGEALNYKSVTESVHDFHREKNPTVAGAGLADGALGLFTSGKVVAPTVIIELKGARTDLDHDKDGSGRTAVQQCWDYLNQLPDTQWGIVSNYVTIRLYHKSQPQRAYEEFTVLDFLDPDRVRQFYFIFEKEGLIGNKIANKSGPPRAGRLLHRTQNQQREVGDKLYVYYSSQRERLIDQLIDEKKMSQDTAIHVAQRLLDRIIFMAFCEDRGLLPEKLIESTWKNVAPLARATNPRWRNFLDTFHAIDKGHPNLDLPTGYNGGLFRYDPVVDDLDLGDEWADVFKAIGDYDFREEGEISVDVLGHIFEKSITELEKLRIVGLFGKQGGDGLAAMPKSAERKRFGIYYTPPQFTRLIVEETLGKLIAERVDPLPDLQQRVVELRKIKVVDPACGSGAFLIAAYERLEDAYEEIARQMRVAGHLQEALNLTNEYADYILFDHLYGVDLSAESVEITQLALWIRSARKGRTLVDLSSNIRRGNSLIRDKSVHPEAFDWKEAFPKVFPPQAPPAEPVGSALADAGAAQRGKQRRLSKPASTEVPPLTSPAESVGSASADAGTAPSRKQRPSAEYASTASAKADPTASATPSPGTPGEGRGEGSGFDVVIGNPPWERMKVQEREFFSLAAPEIAGAVNAADRRKLIAIVESKNPALWERYVRTQESAERILAHMRTTEANFPLSGRGDVNTYMLFAELALQIVAPTGRVGLLVPSGIATDNTTRHFFTDLMESKTLAALFDFENRKLIFPDVDGRFKFSVLLMNGAKVEQENARFVFFAHEMDDLAEPDRQIALSPKDLKLLNPNSRTCPIFRTRRDAEITKRVYRNVPILVDHSRKSGGNPWGVKFCTMFHQTNDAEHFADGEKLLKEGFVLEGNHWTRKKDVYLPLYEAKMIQAFDHRAAGVRIEAGNWMRQGQTEETSLVEHQNPEFVVQPRYWIEAGRVLATMKGEKRPGFVGFKDISSSTNQRTMIAAAIPWSAVTNHFPLLLMDVPWELQFCLLANLNSIAFDYICRQKMGGITLNFFIVEQLPTLHPDRYDESCPWLRRLTLREWISDRVFRLTCTSHDMAAIADAAGFNGKIHKWKIADRDALTAELDAAFFTLYDFSRTDIDYILSTFQHVRKEDEAHGGTGPTRARILASLDELTGLGTPTKGTYAAMSNNRTP